MVRIAPQLTSVQVVLIGTFVPETITADWLVEHGILGVHEGRAAKTRAVENWVSDISTDWCRIFCTTEKFAVISEQAPWVRICDLVVKVFTEIIPTTKIGYMGINRTVKFDAGSWKEKDRLGRILAPREVWGEWGDILASDEGKGESGLSVLTLRQGHGLNDRSAGYIEARIGSGDGTTVVMHVNDHYEAPGKEEEAGAGDLMSRLAGNFEASIKRSDWIVEQIMKQVRM
jgi:hypothetical protein